MAETKVDPLTDWKGFYEELRNESPRGAVLIAGTFLDAHLRNLISKFLVDDPEIVGELLGTENNTDRPLSTFSSRIKAAYCLGLIDKSMYKDLNAIRNIRNTFAHKMHGYSFEEQQIVSWCKSLKQAKMITDAIPNFPNTHRDMFIVGVSLIASRLALKTLEVERTRRTVPKDPEIGQVV